MEVREITFKSAIFDRRVRISSWTPSAKYALSGSWLRFSKGNTATPFVAGRSISSLFQIFHPVVAAKPSSEVMSNALVGLRLTHLQTWVKNPVRLAQIGSCFSQC